MSAVLSLFRSHLLRPVFIALGIALLVQVLVAVALTRSTVTELEADLATRLGVDSQHLSSELEQASHEVTSSLDRLSQNTRQRLSAGLSSRLKDEQVQLRATLEADLKDSATDMAELLAAVAPRAMWDGDTPTLSEFARRAQRNPKEGLEVLRDSARLQKSVQASVEQVHAAIGLATRAAEHQARGAQAVRTRVEVIHAQAEKATLAVVETTVSGKTLDRLAGQLKASLGPFRA